METLHSCLGKKPFQIQATKKKKGDRPPFSVVSEATQLAQAVGDRFVSYKRSVDGSTKISPG